MSIHEEKSMKQNNIRQNRRRNVILILLLLICLLAAGCVWYVSDYYKCEENVQSYFQKNGSVKIEEIDNGLLLDGPGSEHAFVFYPGAKVEYTAYVPLLYQIAESGTDVFLLKMPCNLAFLGMKRADDIISSYEYAHWYLGGHSLGGAMAAAYAAEHLDRLDGLVLLAAYPTKSLQSEGFSVLSLYGSEDGVLQVEKVEQGRAYMPDDYTEIGIQGGNHAQFGKYGVQKKDGVAALSREEQQKEAVRMICEMMEKLL